MRRFTPNDPDETAVDSTIETHLIPAYGDYTSEGLAAVLHHVARYADASDAVVFTDDGVFDACERAIESLTQIRDSARHVRGARRK